MNKRTIKAARGVETLGEQVRILILTVGLVLCAWYGLQIVSPLRLNNDACRLLTMAVSAYQGTGFFVHGQPDPLPVGYPAIVCAMMRVGLGSARWLNALNVLFVFIYCASFYWILSADPQISAATRMLIIMLPLASWVWVKHVSIPLTEMPYLCVSFLALAALNKCWSARGARVAGWITLALALAWVAIKIRTIGIALFPAAGLTVILHPELRHWFRYLRFNHRRASIAGVCGLLLAAIAATTVVRVALIQGPSQQYFGYLGLYKSMVLGGAGLIRSATDCGRFHVRELGEILLNLPGNKIGMAARALPVAGGLALLLLGSGFSQMIRRFAPLGFYAGFYALIIFAWPFYDPRFWLPLLPLLVLCAWFSLERFYDSAPVALLVAVYVCVFLALGFVALGYSTRLSLAGNRFADLYGDGRTRASYRAALEQNAALQAPEAVEPDVIVMLERFEPRAAHRH